MKVSDKVARAKEAIRLISTHDDAPEKEVQTALDELVIFIKDENKQMARRRIEKAKMAKETR